MSNHVIITGPGRSGTTLLVELLTELGVDTGFDPGNLYKHPSARAGLEINLLKSMSPPYVVKDPEFSEYVDSVLENSEIIIDHVFITIRDVEAAVASRVAVESNTNREKYKDKSVPGGLTGTQDKLKQADVLKNRLYNLELALARTDCPITLIQYPLLTKDPEYLFDKLTPILGSISFDKFRTTFARVVDPSLVHSFSDGDLNAAYKKYGTKHVFFEAYSAKEAVGHVQLFFDLGEGYSERNSVEKCIAPGSNKIRFDLGVDQPLSGIRFDPGVEACIISDVAIEIEEYSGNHITEKPVQSNGHHEDGHYAFVTNDPQLYFPGCKSAKVVWVVLRYESIGKGTKTKLLRFLEGRLESSRKEVALISQRLDSINSKSSTSIWRKFKGFLGLS